MVIAETTLSGRISAVLADAEDSAKEAARKTGIPAATISALAYGNRRSATTETLVKLCKAYGVSLDYLLGLSKRRYIDGWVPEAEGDRPSPCTECDGKVRGVCRSCGWTPHVNEARRAQIRALSAQGQLSSWGK